MHVTRADPDAVAVHGGRYYGRVDEPEYRSGKGGESTLQRVGARIPLWELSDSLMDFNGRVCCLLGAE